MGYRNGDADRIEGAADALRDRPDFRRRLRLDLAFSAEPFAR
jgi:hypothetical protein